MIEYEIQNLLIENLLFYHRLVQYLVPTLFISCVKKLHLYYQSTSFIGCVARVLHQTIFIKNCFCKQGIKKQNKFLIFALNLKLKFEIELCYPMTEFRYHVYIKTFVETNGAVKILTMSRQCMVTFNVADCALSGQCIRSLPRLSIGHFKGFILPIVISRFQSLNHMSG